MHRLAIFLFVSAVICLSLNANAATTFHPQKAMAQQNLGSPTALPNSQKTRAFLTFQSAGYGIRMIYPSEWRISRSYPDYTRVATFVSPLQNLSDALPVTLSLAVVNYASNITMKGYTDLVLNITKAGNQTKIIESKPIIISHIPGYSITYAPAGKQFPDLKLMRTWTVKGNKVYILTYTAETSKFSRYLPTIQRMLNSVQIA